MIRLALNGAAETVVPRLRGATVQTTAGLDALSGCDAAAFVGPALPDIDALQRLLCEGKHVLLTTGACLSGEALQRLSTVAGQAGVQFAVVNPDRYLPSRQLVKQQLDRGLLGEVGLVRLHRWTPPAATAPLLGDLDLALWLVGKRPGLVSAVEAGLATRFVQVHLGFPGGGMALVDHFAGLPPGDGYTSLSVIGSSGAACADDHQNSQLVYQGGPARAVRTGEGNRHTAALLQEFVDALRTGRDLSASVTAWQHVLAVADAVSKALASRQAIALEGR